MKNVLYLFALLALASACGSSDEEVRTPEERARALCEKWSTCPGAPPPDCRLAKYALQEACGYGCYDVTFEECVEFAEEYAAEAAAEGLKCHKDGGWLEPGPWMVAQGRLAELGCFYE